MPLTVEERKRRKQEKKAQNMREAEERRMKTRKDDLSREVDASLRVRTAHGKRWYADIYAGKWPVARQDMEAAWRWVERAVDCKDFVIAHLADTMDEAILQEAMSWQDFVIKVDDRIDDFLKRIDTLDKDFNDKLTNMLNKAMQETVLESCDQTALENYYKTILFIMEDKFQESAIAEQGEYVTKRDEEGKKEAHKIEAMSAALEKTLQATVADIRDTLAEYRTSTEARRKEVEALSAKDNYYTDMIRRQDTRMAKLCDDFSSLQSQVNEKQESRLLLDDLKRDREETYSEYTEMRARLTRDSEMDESKLLTLTGEISDVLQYLQGIVDKGEKILRMGALCRKLETQEEKVIPFGFPNDTKEEHEDYEILDPFSLFWRRYAHANLIKRKLEPTLDALRAGQGSERVSGEHLGYHGSDKRLTLVLY